VRHLFGTDGIRGVAGAYPLDDATVSKIGAALVATLRETRGDAELRFVLGCDTRESSEAIARAVAGGISAAGGTVEFAGVITTPGVAYLVTHRGAAAGVVVSASHNPWNDNGVKIFSSEGRKLPDELEARIETRIAEAAEAPPRELARDPALVDQYVSYLVGTLPHRLDGLTVVIDAAHGAAHRIAPRAFTEAGARVVPLNVDPDGRNINDGCGALHPDGMAARVVAERAAFGIALDGDADRIVLADHEGRLLDGDDILFLWTLELTREGRKPDVVVGTVMSNWGLESALRERGVALARTPVGDRYVVEEMERLAAPLGGEPSGHLIRRELSTTGDGTLTGLHLAALLAAEGRPLASLPRLVHTPQVLKNVKVKERVPFAEIPAVAAEQARCEALLGAKGRILLRYSGTETLARVMVEGTEPDLVESVAGRLASTIQQAIGL
jgi:phosphoglucosamine mutase